MEGDASIVSLGDNMSIIKHETIETNERSNIAYCGTVVRSEANGTFLIGSENKLVTKYTFDKRDLEVQKVGFFKGHSNSVRHVAVSQSNAHLLSTCEDHSLRLWDYRSYEPLIIFTGHHDNVVSASLLMWLDRRRLRGREHGSELLMGPDPEGLEVLSARVRLIHIA